MSVRSLPTGWKKSAMGEIGQYLNGFAFNSKTWGTTGRPIIRIQNLTGSGDSFNYFDGDIDDRYVVRNGDLLFSWAATLGVYLWSGPEAVLNQHIFKVKSLINTSFHRYLIEHNIALMTTQTHGTGMVHLTKKKFDAIPVEIPPRDEQERIVEILEEQLSRLDAAVKSVQTVREKAAQFRRSLLHAAFTGALTQTDAGDMANEGIPPAWEVKRLDAVADVRLGRQRSPKDHHGVTMRKYLRAANVTWAGLDLSDVKEMNFTNEEMRIFILEPGDLLVNEASGSATEVGKVCRFDGELEECGFQNTLLRVRPFRVLNDYLFWYLRRNAYTGAYLEQSRGVGIFHLGRAKLAAWQMPIPPLPEQGQIVEILEEQMSRLDATLAVADEVERKANALRRSLLHAAFTGELTRSWRESHV